MTEQALKDQILAILYQAKAATSSGAPATRGYEHFVGQTGRSTADVAGAVTELEQAGAVRRQPNGEWTV